VAIAYLLWAGALVWLLLTARYQAFLRPGFWALLLWAVVILALLAGALVFGGEADLLCRHLLGGKRILSSLALRGAQEKRKRLCNDHRAVPHALKRISLYFFYPATQ
jgi:heme A synthase